MANQNPLIFSTLKNVKTINDVVAVTPMVCRVLIVDDSELKMLLCTMAMEKWCQTNDDMTKNLIAYQIEQAVDAKQAMEKVKHSIEAKQYFDVIIMDHNLPDNLTGIDLTNTILKLLADYPKPVVIGCSDTYHNPPKNLDLSCYNAVISYPFKRSELFELLGTHVTPPLKTRRLVNK